MARTYSNMRPRAGVRLGPLLLTTALKKGKVRTHVYATGGRLTWRIK